MPSYPVGFTVLAEILRVANIESATVIENDQDFPDDMGRPPHSFESYVLGDATKDEEIARAIFKKKPIGVKSHGEIMMNIPDEGGFLHEIHFTRSKEIYLKIKLRIRAGNTFEGDNGKQEIASKLSDYVMNLGNGGAVIHSSLYGYVHSVEGVIEVCQLLLSVDNGQTYSIGNVDCKAWQVARLLIGDIDIEVLNDE